MEPLRVWAPAAREVAVEIRDGGERLPLAPTVGGWWQALPGTVPAGTDYRFVVDGEAPFPDPRSPWQPRGVHGPSRRVNHTAYAWRDAG